MEQTFLGRFFRPHYSIPAGSLSVAAFIVLFGNQLLWHNLATSSVLFIVALVSYFSDSFGVVIDKSMIHNLLETDVREARELVTWPLFLHQGLYGVLPAFMVMLAPIQHPVWRRGLLLRAGGIIVSLAIAVALFMADYKGLALFGRENWDLQVFINPSYPVYALAPKEQTHVPMKFWASSEFLVEQQLDKTVMLVKRNASLSHGNLFHSMLGLFNVRTSLYRGDLDLFSFEGRHSVDKYQPLMIVTG